MKQLYFGIIYAISLINTISMEAMQSPIYQSYQSPVWQQGVSRGWERTKEFVQRHKGKIAAAISIVAVVVAAFYAGDRIRKYAKKMFMKETEDTLKEFIVFPEDKKTKDTLILLGYFAKRTSLQGLQDYFNDPKMPNRKVAFKKLLETYPGLLDALAKLAEATPEQVANITK